MKVYFTTGYENPKESMDNINTILDTIKKEGHTIAKRPLKSEHGSDTYSVDESKLTHIFDFRDEPIDQIYKTATKRIKSSDVVIAEASYHLSPGLGFELGFALHEKKPVLVLINSESDAVLSEVIEGNPSKLLENESYTDKTDLNKKLLSFLKSSKQKLDTKFILIISPEIDKYLEWTSDNRRMHKAQVVRNAIEDMMKKDKDYEDFLSQ